MSACAVKWEYMDSWPDGEREQVPAAGSTTVGSTTDPARAAILFEQSIAIMARLRAPDGCPWDREQTFDSIRKYTLEEAYEVFDAIERRDFPHLAEELGDLMLQVLFYAEMAANEGHFTISDVLDHLNRKLVRRHPHVFGEEASRAAGNVADVDANVEGSAAAVLRNWEEIKAFEKKPAGAESRLDSVQRAMPALAEAAKLGSKAAKAGFDWPHWRDLLPKVAEEVAELEAEAEAGRKPEIEAELGDLLFTVVNLARHLGVEAEMALRGCNLRFRERFREMELAAQRPLEEMSAGELEGLWVGAKRKLSGQGSVVRDQEKVRAEPTADKSRSFGSAEKRFAQDDKSVFGEETTPERFAQDDKSVGLVGSGQDAGIPKATADPSTALRFAQEDKSFIGEDTPSIEDETSPKQSGGGGA